MPGGMNEPANASCTLPLQLDVYLLKRPSRRDEHTANPLSIKQVLRPLRVPHIWFYEEYLSLASISWEVAIFPFMPLFPIQSGSTQGIHDTCRIDLDLVLSILNDKRELVLALPYPLAIRIKELGLKLKVPLHELAGVDCEVAIQDSPEPSNHDSAHCVPRIRMGIRYTKRNALKIKLRQLLNLLLLPIRDIFHSAILPPL